MNIFVQSLLVFGVMLLVLGYFQFLRSGDIISIVQEMFRPQYLVPAALVAVAYLILKAVFSLLNKAFGS
jgi:hypothetical protein